AYNVTQRTPEIGIRVALGATRSDVLRMVVGQAAWLAIAGILAGAFAAYLLTKSMAGLLFEISPFDPATVAAVALVLLSVGLVAGYVPGRRARRVDRVVALVAE